jgi:predicted RNase H-like HicB family nuclease
LSGHYTKKLNFPEDKKMHESVLNGSVSKSMNITVALRSREDGSYLAECNEIPGCSAVGENPADAKTKIQAAIEGCLDTLLSELSKATAGNRALAAGRSRNRAD